MHQRLKIVRHGRRYESVKAEPLRHGTGGNEQTLRYAAQMVREDSRDESLRAFAESLICGCAPHDSACAVQKLFEFARDVIRYVEDPAEVERIADAWRTIEKGEGDCGDKSILLASLLGTIGIRSQFIVQSWDGDLSDGYDHVHIEVFMSDGTTAELDPTNEHALAGWEASDRGRASFEIWPNEVRSSVFGVQRKAGMDYYQTPDSRLQTSHGLSGLFDDLAPQLISSGIQVGAQYGASALQQHRVSAQQSAQIGAAFENLVSQAKALFDSIDAKGPYLTADDLNNAAAAYQYVESFVQQNPTEYVTTQWNSANYKQAAQNYLTKFQRALAAQQTGAGSQGPGAGPTVLSPQSAVLGASISPWAIAAVAVVLIFVWKSSQG